MSNLNLFIVSGHVVKTADTIVTRTSTYIKFSINNTQSYKKNNEWVSENHYFNCIAFGKIADRFTVGGLIQGQSVHVEGNLKQSKYEDKDGITRYSYTLFVDRLVLLPSEPKESNSVSKSSPVIQKISDQINGRFSEEIPF